MFIPELCLEVVAATNTIDEKGLSPLSVAEEPGFVCRKKSHTTLPIFLTQSG
jgi:hypothetical protein